MRGLFDLNFKLIGSWNNHRRQLAALCFELHNVIDGLREVCQNEFIEGRLSTINRLPHHLNQQVSRSVCVYLAQKS